MIFNKLKNELRRSSNLRLVLVCLILLLVVGIAEHFGFIVYPSKEVVPITGRELV